MKPVWAGLGNLTVCAAGSVYVQGQKQRTESMNNVPVRWCAEAMCLVNVSDTWHNKDAGAAGVQPFSSLAGVCFLEELEP